VIEVAVIHALTGAVLLDTLVHPGDAEIDPEATAVHGLTRADLANAPTWREVLPELLAVTEGRPILAYNAYKFDQPVVVSNCESAGLDPQHLGDAANWGCLMLRLSDRLRTTASRKLGGSHRALGDCYQGREVLLNIARITPHPLAPTR
jgi:DNA polymerase-3 subunit epsilon